MNKEIKEILDYLKNYEHYKYRENGRRYKEIEGWEIDILLDYITNLQQELEEYKDTETYSKRFLYKANKDRLNANLDLIKENEMLKDAQKNFEKQFIKEMNYKTRCEKAIKYIYDSYKGVENEDGSLPMYLHDTELLEILEGKSDE